MNPTIGLQLLLFSLLLAGGSYYVYQLAPTASGLTLIAGLAGSGLSVVWGLLAMTGRRGKAFPILTLIGVGFALLSQAVHAWSGLGEFAEALATTLLLALTLAMLMRIAYAGVLFDVPPTPPTAAAPAGPNNSRPVKGNPHV